MNWIITTYIIYLIISAFLTIWVGHTLYYNGRAFVVMALQEVSLADSVNKLLLVGFYLINTAYVLLVLKEEHELHSFENMLELLSLKLGLIVTILAGMHFFNIAALYFLKNKNILSTQK